jgi:hypothetical protein
MTMPHATTQPLAPNADDMRGHLAFLFGDAREFDDGLIEIAVRTAQGWQSRLFGTDEISAAATWAAQENAKGSNVYVGAALRDPDTPPFGRASDSDHYATTAAYVDLDESDAANAAAARTGACKPDFVVCTGVHPHRRLQLWWKLEEPVSDPARHRGLMEGLADTLGGDRTVCNPSRIMRLAGSIAWPMKPGRVEEMTFVVPLKYQPSRHTAEAVAAAYPKDPKVTSIDLTRKNDPIDRMGGKNSLGLDTGKIEDGRERHMRDTVLAVFIEYVGTHGCEPDAQELYDRVWPQYSARVDFSRPGRGEDEVAKKCQQLLRRFAAGRLRGLPDTDAVAARYAVKQAGREAERPKLPEPVTDPTPDRIFIPSKEFAAAWQPADYLVDGLIQRGYCYSLTSPTGHGKTAVILNLAASIGTGQQFAGAETVTGRVGYFAAENPNDVQARWIGMQDAMKFTDAAVWFCPDTINLETSFEKIAAEAEAAGGMDLIVIDTSQAFFRGDDENSNAQAVNHAKAMRRLTRLPGNPCVIILTHPVKNPSKENLLPRGGGGFLAEVDGNLTLWNDSDMMVLHHQGKLRGPGFAPLNFMLKQVNCPRLIDRKGRQLPTVIAQYISEDEYSRKLVENASDQDKVMILILSRKGNISVADIARINQWVTPMGAPLKSKVARLIKKLKDDKLVTTKRNGRLALTKAGEREISAKAKALGIDGAGEDDADFE